MQPLTKRQREILDYLNDFIQQHGYAPSLEEVGKRFGLSSLATVHKHLTNLEDKGFIRRRSGMSRALEVVPQRQRAEALELPLLGIAAAGRPIEAVLDEKVSVPEELVRKPDSFVLKVSGDHCTVLKVVASSNAHLEDVLARLGQHGPLRTNVIWSAAMSRRPIDWESGIPEFEPPSEWEVSWRDSDDPAR